MDQLDPEQILRASIARAASKALGIQPDSIPLTPPPSAEVGDYASPLCFELARTARKAPRELAKAIVDAFEPGDGIARVEVAGAGYINAFLDRPAFLRRWLSEDEAAQSAPVGGKIIVEHTNINPNKAAHIGHLRNAVLGDTLVRFLRRIHHVVEIQNYIDDTGVQVADLVVGFRILRGEELSQVVERYSAEKLQQDGLRFDYIAWDLYAEVTRFYESDKSNLSHRDTTLKAMEEGGNPIADLAAHVAHRMVQHHLRTMDRIDVRYNVLPRESDILALRFWDTAFERLRESGAIRKLDSGKNDGCWVMDLADADEGLGEDQKVIVRSNGTVTYVGKDIAYQLWKFGLLGRDFHYATFDWSPGSAPYQVWTSRPEAGREQAPAFGKAETVYNVIDTRQSYLQRVVNQGLRSLGHESEAGRSIHYSYEMVALTPASVEAMFPEHRLSDSERGKSHLEMSGRKGLGVKADDLLDRLFERAGGEIRQRNPELDEEATATIAAQISIGALRYYMLRFSRNTIVAFDLDAALSFDGETGPYLQYSVVRARNILSKLQERFGAAAVDPHNLATGLDLDALPSQALAEHWNLAHSLFRVDAVVRQAVESLELSMVAKHAYVLAQSFNSFYHRYPVVREADVSARMTRTAIVYLYCRGMTELLALMGISTPQRM